MSETGGAHGPVRAARHTAPALSPAQREAAIASLQRGELDVLVIGGGVVGTGAALDAASRRLRTGLVEAADWAAGASSASSKLVHGGVRYLQMLDFGLVREALAERALLLELAPHLVRPVPFLYPLRHRIWERPFAGTGLSLYDALARLGKGRLPRHRQLSRSEARRLAPSLRPELLLGGIEYWDAQVDDARFVVELARTAAGLGAELLTGATAIALLDERGAPVVASGGSERGVRGARVCLEDGRLLDVRARAVLAATGAWSDEIQRLAGHAGALPVRPSKGVHLVVAREAIRSERALVVPTERSVLFVLPFGAHWILGTTDTPWQLGPERPVASHADVEYLLGEANKVLDPPLVAADVVAVYAGLRPLVAPSDAETTRASREHAVARLAPGLYLVSGGKYTTYRVMARDAIDALVPELGSRVLPSATRSIPLAGAAAPGATDTWARTREGSSAMAGPSGPVEGEAASSLAAEHGVSLAVAARLIGRYGVLASEVLEAAQREPGLRDPLPGGAGHLLAEARYAASHEGALHLADVLERRTRLAITTADRGLEAAPATAAAIAPVLGWDPGRCAAEVDAYERRVASSRRAEEAGDDDAAFAEVRCEPAARSAWDATRSATAQAEG